MPARTKTRTALWSLLLAAAMFILVGSWIVLWSGLVLAFYMMISPVAVFLPLAALSIVVGYRVARRWQPRTLRQACFTAACLLLVGTAPVWVRWVQMNVFWTADIPDYPRSERVEKRTKIMEDINQGPRIEQTVRLPASASSALAFYASELERRGWTKKNDAGPACWIEQHAVHFCRFQYCKGLIRIAYDAASSQDQGVTAARGPVAIRFIVESPDTPCAPGQGR